MAIPMVRWSESSLLRQQVVQAWWVLASNQPDDVTRDVHEGAASDDQE